MFDFLDELENKDIHCVIENENICVILKTNIKDSYDKIIDVGKTYNFRNVNLIYKELKECTEKCFCGCDKCKKFSKLRHKIGCFFEDVLEYIKYG